MQLFVDKAMAEIDKLVLDKEYIEDRTSVALRSTGVTKAKWIANC